MARKVLKRMKAFVRNSRNEPATHRYKATKKAAERLMEATSTVPRQIEKDPRSGAQAQPDLTLYPRYQPQMNEIVKKATRCEKSRQVHKNKMSS